jgi:hypothetical protein
MTRMHCISNRLSATPSPVAGEGGAIAERWEGEGKSRAASP